LVVGISRQEIKEFGVEPMINGSVDFVLATTTQEGAAKGSDRSLGELKELSLVNNDIEQDIAFAAEDVIGVISHGGDALIVSEVDNLGLLDFG